MSHREPQSDLARAERKRAARLVREAAQRILRLPKPWQQVAPFEQLARDIETGDE